MVTDGLLSQGYHDHKRFSKSNNQILREIQRSAILATNDNDDSLQFCDFSCHHLLESFSHGEFANKDKIQLSCNVQLQDVSTFFSFKIHYDYTFEIFYHFFFGCHISSPKTDILKRKPKVFIKQHFTLIRSSQAQSKYEQMIMDF